MRSSLARKRARSGRPGWDPRPRSRAAPDCRARLYEELTEERPRSRYECGMKLAAVLVMAPLLTSCTAIGYGVGSAIPKHTTIDAHAFVEAPPLPGATIAIGDVEGHFVASRSDAIDLETNGITSSIAIAPDTPIR